MEDSCNKTTFCTIEEALKINVDQMNIDWLEVSVKPQLAPTLLKNICAISRRALLNHRLDSATFCRY